VGWSQQSRRDAHERGFSAARWAQEGHELYTTLNKTNSIRRDVPHKQPEAVKPEVIGGGKIGPDYALTGPQVQLQADLHAAKVMNGLPEGISYEEFERGYNAFMREWESSRAGRRNSRCLLATRVIVGSR